MYLCAIVLVKVLRAGGVPEPDDAVGHVERGPGLAQQPVVRAVVLASLLGRHVVRPTDVQRAHHVRRDADVGRRVPGRGTGVGGHRVHVPGSRSLSAAGRVAPSRRANVGQQPLFRVLLQTVSAELRVRGRHAHATAAAQVDRGQS